MTTRLTPDPKDRHVSLLDADPQNRPFSNSTRTIKMGVCINVSINEIDKSLRPAAEMRASLNEEAIQTYSESFDALPPVKLVHDRQAGIYWVRDGAHTLSAAKLLGMTEIKAHVEEGEYLDAWKLAARENGSHGVRLNNADKRARVERALKSGVMRHMSNRQIAEMCGVSNNFVSSLAACQETASCARVSSDDTSNGAQTRRQGRQALSGDTANQDADVNRGNSPRGDNSGAYGTHLRRRTGANGLHLRRQFSGVIG